MLKIDKKILQIISSGGIAFFTAILIIIVASGVALIAVPYPSENYGFPYYKTQEECESAGSIWTADDIGEYCYISNEQYDQYYAEAEAAYNNTFPLYQIVSWLGITIPGIILALAGLFLVKNKPIAYGLVGGGGLAIVYGLFVLSLLIPILTALLLLVLLAVFVAIALKYK